MAAQKMEEKQDEQGEEALASKMKIAKQLSDKLALPLAQLEVHLNNPKISSMPIQLVQPLTDALSRFRTIDAAARQVASGLSTVLPDVSPGELGKDITKVKKAESVFCQIAKAIPQ